MMAGLCMHAFLEAMPLDAEHDHGHSQPLVAIAVHKFPGAIVLLKSGQARAANPLPCNTHHRHDLAELAERFLRYDCPMTGPRHLILNLLRHEEHPLSAR